MAVLRAADGGNPLRASSSNVGFAPNVVVVEASAVAKLSPQGVHYHVGVMYDHGDMSNERMLF